MSAAAAPATIVDLFAGPGGLDEGLASLGVHDVLGIEWDPAACDTAEAAGHARLRRDVRRVDPANYIGIDGLIGSPPCTTLSAAGRGSGRLVVGLLADALEVVATTGRYPYPLRRQTARTIRDRLQATRPKATRAERSAVAWRDADTSLLIVEPARWVRACRPRWVALEQVPAALPLWRRLLTAIEPYGYRGWAAVLNAADYGVPQTRRRAFMVAALDRRPPLPEPTHYDPRKGLALFGQPWITMAEALGWADDEVLDRRTNSRTADGGATPSPPVPADRPAPTVVRGIGTSQWMRRPAPTVCGHRRPRWAYQRPATTIVGSFRPDIVAGPGYWRAGDGPRQAAPDSIPVTLEEAALLQGFRPDYPWSGNRTQRGAQIGNAVPPPLAAAVLAQVAAPLRSAA